MLIHTSHAGMGPSEDEEVGLFSSHSAEGEYMRLDSADL
jgi:hypothetical protein